VTHHVLALRRERSDQRNQNRSAAPNQPDREDPRRPPTPHLESVADWSLIATTSHNETCSCSKKTVGSPRRREARTRLFQWQDFRPLTGLPV
jgi:hypothetical protein